MKKACCFVLFLLGVSVVTVFAQTGPPQPLQHGFSTLLLGSSIDEAKKNLKTDPLFLYDGEPEVQFLPGGDQKLIRVIGLSYIQRAVFQFDSDKLFSISLIIENNMIDFFTMFTTLQTKYGEPTSFQPDMIQWSNEKTLIVLEKPLNVKYIDLEAQKQLLEKSDQAESATKLHQDKFLELF